MNETGGVKADPSVTAPVLAQSMFLNYVAGLSGSMSAQINVAQAIPAHVSANVPPALYLMLSSCNMPLLSWRNREFVGSARLGGEDIFFQSTTSWFWVPVMLNAASYVAGLHHVIQPDNLLHLDGALFNLSDVFRFLVVLFSNGAALPGSQFLHVHQNAFRVISPRGDMYIHESAQNAVIQLLFQHNRPLCDQLQMWFDCLYGSWVIASGRQSHPNQVQRRARGWVTFFMNTGGVVPMTVASTCFGQLVPVWV